MVLVSSLVAGVEFVVLETCEFRVGMDGCQRARIKAVEKKAV
jgi:hypothetical protein